MTHFLLLTSPCWPIAQGKQKYWNCTRIHPMLQVTSLSYIISACTKKSHSNTRTAPWTSWSINSTPPTTETVEEEAGLPLSSFTCGFYLAICAMTSKSSLVQCRVGILLNGNMFPENTFLNSGNLYQTLLSCFGLIYCLGNSCYYLCYSFIYLDAVNYGKFWF